MWEICQPECQKMCVMVHKASACGHAPLCYRECSKNNVVSFYMAHCSKYLWLNVSCASKWGWFGSHVGACGGTSCDNLHWRVQPVCKGVRYVWRYVLTAVGPERMCAWSRLAPSMLGIVCSLCHRLWRALCGMWCTMGELFQMRKARKSWRSVLQSFELWRPLCQCCAEQGQLHRRGARGTGIFMVWTRHEM